MSKSMEREEALKARGMTKLGYVSVYQNGFGPFWYGVWGDKDGNIFFNGAWGLHPWNLQTHGNIYTEEEVKEIDDRIYGPDTREAQETESNPESSSAEEQRLSDESVKKLKDIRKRLEDAAKELDEIVTEEDGRIDEAVAAQQDIENDWEDMIYDIRDAIEAINSALDTLPNPD